MLRIVVIASLTLAASAAVAVGQTGIQAGPEIVRPQDVGEVVGASIVSTPTASDYKRAYNQGLAALAAKDWKLAQRRFAFVIKGYPNDADGQAYLGFSARRAGDVRKAEKAFEKALKADPEHLIANVDYGKWLVEQNRVPEARARLAALQGCCANKPETKELADAIAGATKPGG